MRLSLDKTIKYLRKQFNSVNDQDTIYLILAMLECGIDNTPYFSGMTAEELLTSLKTIVLLRMTEWIHSLVAIPAAQYPDMISFVLDCRLFAKVNRNDVAFIYEDLKKGILKYEFKRFDTVGG